MADWAEVFGTIKRAVSSQDAIYYRRLQNEAHKMLIADINAGMAVHASEAGQLGKLVQQLLNGLLSHSLCQRLSRTPEIYLHHGIAMPFATFANVIFVPTAQAGGAGIFEEQEQMTRAAIAHELGHIIANDSSPRNLARQWLRNLNQSSERRADLIAAYLCGDGGRTMAEYLVTQLLLWGERASQNLIEDSWSARVANKVNLVFDRRYPDTGARIRCLQQWAEDFKRGKALPLLDISLEESFRPTASGRVR